MIYSPVETSVPNRLMASLTPACRARTLEHCRSEVLEVGSVLAESGIVSESVHFVETGFLSIMASGGDLAEVEIGLIGREGMAGGWLALGQAVSPFRVVAQTRCETLRMDRTAFQAVCTDGTGMREAVFAYAQQFTEMLAETCRANAKLTVEGRLARWLLMAHDRIDADHLAITHETLSKMLGVRRPGVTDALHVLEGEHMIKSTRRMIQILDRQKLGMAAKGFYGPASRMTRLLPHGAHAAASFA